MTAPDEAHYLVRFRTETGSRYELDVACRRITRLSGNHPPTPRQGDDGTWKQFERLTTQVIPGETVDIIWRTVDGIAQMTFTSRVLHVAVAQGCFAHSARSAGLNWI